MTGRARRGGPGLGAGAALGLRGHLRRADAGPITDDHVPLQQVGIRAIDLIDLDYGPGNSWHHTPDDTSTR